MHIATLGQHFQHGIGGPNATAELSHPGCPVTRTPLRAARREELVGIVGWSQETNGLIVDAWRDIGVPAGMLLTGSADCCSVVTTSRSDDSTFAHRSTACNLASRS